MKTLDIPVSINGKEVVFSAVMTDASKVYDGFGAFTLIDYEQPLDHMKYSTRLVLIPRDHLDWAIARYSSGLYAAYHTAEDLESLYGVEAANIANVLWSKLSAA